MKVKIKKSTNTLIELLVGKLDLCITKKLPTIFDYNPWYKNWIYFTKGKKKNHKWSGRFFIFVIIMVKMF